MCRFIDEEDIRRLGWRWSYLNHISLKSFQITCTDIIMLHIYWQKVRITSSVRLTRIGTNNKILVPLVHSMFICVEASIVCYSGNISYWSLFLKYFRSVIFFFAKSLEYYTSIKAFLQLLDTQKILLQHSRNTNFSCYEFNHRDQFMPYGRSFTSLEVWFASIYIFSNGVLILYENICQFVCKLI